jgi:hypothetical protein
MSQDTSFSWGRAVAIVLGGVIALCVLAAIIVIAALVGLDDDLDTLVMVQPVAFGSAAFVCAWLVARSAQSRPMLHVSVMLGMVACVQLRDVVKALDGGAKMAFPHLIGMVLLLGAGGIGGWLAERSREQR